MVNHLLLLRDFHNSGVGLFLGGTIFGIIIGTSWEKSYELIRSGLQERRQGIRRRHPMNPFVKIHHWGRDKLGIVGFILLLNCVVWVFIGAFQISQYTRLNSYIQCQAEFNQQSSVARTARTDANVIQDQALYAWIASLPPITNSDKPSTPAQLQHFRVTLDRALSTYYDAVEAQKANPYPEDPVNTCGNY